MKRKLKLKPFVLPTLYAVFVGILLVTVFFSSNGFKIEEVEEDPIFVTGSILDSYVPVISLDTTIIRPYATEVTIGHDFYSYEDDVPTQTNSIIFYENTYMQNSGIDYISEKTFDVLSVLPGEVIEVKKEDLLGNVVTIRHDNDFISVYQSLGNVLVEKGEQVSQGQVIGTSGVSTLNKDLQNHLHFELIIQGQIKDPENYFDKKLSEIFQ